MTEGAISVVEPGLSTTVQDTGRFGHYHIGMPPSGAMDQFSHTVANYLVGNSEDDATLEMTYSGADLEFNQDSVVAVTGSDMSPALDGDPVPMYTAIAVEAGQTLTFEFATDGARTYLAVAGGIDVTPIMESRSTYTLIGIGGYEGRSLEEGDQLDVGSAGDRSAMVGATVAEEHRHDLENAGTVRVVMGLCDYRLTDESRAEFLDSEWKVAPEADRVGYRLKGPDIDFVEREQPFGAGTDPSNVVDLGYPVGSIQVPEQPIVLMADAVTGGGYATIGTVISVDRDLLSQRPTHSTVRFQGVTLDEALEARAARQDTLAAIRDGLP